MKELAFTEEQLALIGNAVEFAVRFTTDSTLEQDHENNVSLGIINDNSNIGNPTKEQLASGLQGIFDQITSYFTAK